MVEISKSGSGEGPGGVIPWGYSTLLRTQALYPKLGQFGIGSE